MKKLITLSALSAAMLISPAYAAAPKWNLIEVDYNMLDVEDSSSFDPQGLSLFGSFLLNDNVFIAGSFSRTSDDFEEVDFDFDQTSIAVGYRYGYSATTDFYGAVSYEDVEVKGSSRFGTASVDDDGFGLTAGVRSMLTPKFELGASLTYLNLDSDNDTSFSIDAYYYFSEQVAAHFGFQTADLVDGYSVGIRYAF